jgi:hypothetical protein
MEFPPTIPFTDQVTPLLDVPVIVAVNCCVPVTGTDAVVKFRLNMMLMVTENEADLLVSAWLVAVMVTLCGVGTNAGAV